MNDIDNLSKDLIKLKASILDDFEESYEKTMQDILKESKNNSPVLTGALKKSLYLSKNKKYSYSIKSDLPYARIVEEGGKNRKASLYIKRSADKFDYFLEKNLKDRWLYVNSKFKTGVIWYIFTVL